MVDNDKLMEENKITEARSYLASTDWYYARLAETGEVVPEDVKSKRLKARELLRTNGE
jgi:hypothetical protein